MALLSAQAADTPLATALLGFGLTALFVALIGAGVRLVARRMSRGTLDVVTDFLRHDPAICVITDDEGLILAANDAGRSRIDQSNDTTLGSALRYVIADPGAILLRVRRDLEQADIAETEVVLAGRPGRIIAHRLGPRHLLWRIAEEGQGDPVTSLSAPTFMLGRHGTVLFMNDAARGLAGGRLRSIDELQTDRPLRDGAICRVQTPAGARAFRVARIDNTVGRQELVLLPAEGAILSDAGDLVRFDGLPVPMLRLSCNGRIHSSNVPARTLLNSTAPEGETLSQHFVGLSRPLEHWLAEATAALSTPSEFLRLKHADHETYIQATLCRVEGPDGAELLAVLSDATALKSLEAQFVQSQKMQAIGQLAGGVAHDFNNLLTAISGHCDLLLLRHDQGDQDYGDLVQINQNANRAAALVSQLLAFSRKQTLQPEVLDLGDTLADLTHLLNRLVGERVTLTLTHDPVLTPIRADKRQLEQVLMNLVVNARDAMPEGGEIRIETEVIVLARAIHRDRATVPPGDYVCVRVIDCGIGIAPDKLNKVFEPFYTTKRTGEGTGLGLSTAYGIVKQTGGYIFVDSVLGKGTTFIMYFPVHRGEPAPRPIEKAAARTMATSQGEGVVLLVEDEAPVRAFASRALRLRGYTVLEAESAEDALRTLEDPALDVDIFVTDVVMPGMDGPSWVREARKTRPDVRVIFVSGYAEGAFDGGIVTVPNSVFLSKPFSLNQLTETVHQQLH
ncbi:MAG: response regulator [Roseivivax sp.]|nr:response regulator [Roseivivax sp.]